MNNTVEALKAGPKTAMLEALELLISEHGLEEAQWSKPPAAIGSVGHTWVLPEATQTRQIDRGTAKRSAVMVLFSRAAVLEESSLLMVRRSPGMRQNPGQIALPGGKVDAGDASIVATALREMTEETGITASTVQVLGVLPEVELPAGNFVVAPVIGVVDNFDQARLMDMNESDRVFSVPVATLVDASHRGTAVIDFLNPVRRTQGYVTDEGVIWGFTASLIAQILCHLGLSPLRQPDRELLVVQGSQLFEGVHPPLVGATYQEISSGDEFLLAARRSLDSFALVRRMPDGVSDVRDRLPAAILAAEYRYVRCNHGDDCCRHHGTHSSPHRSCLLR